MEARDEDRECKRAEVSVAPAAKGEGVGDWGAAASASAPSAANVPRTKRVSHALTSAAPAVA